MKITSDQMLDTPTRELLKIEIEWNPKNDAHEGHVAMIATVIDTVRQLIVLEEALNAMEDNDEEEA